MDMQQALEPPALRPMVPGDVHEIIEVTLEAFAGAASRAREEPRVMDEAARDAVRRRLEHHLATDPEGCWVAELAGRPVGAAVALLREGLWILSLLMVRGEAQGQGVGRRLLDTVQTYGEGGERGLVAASLDPFAWRRYWAAGFTVRPAAMASGRVRRAALPPTPGVRAGRPDDYELADEVDRALRGAAHGPDLVFMAEAPGERFLVADHAGDRGYVLTHQGSPTLLAAERPETAQRLLWAALAESGPDVHLAFLTAEQDWALDVCFRAGLAVRPGTALCTRGPVGPLWPYLANGPFL